MTSRFLALLLLTFLSADGFADLNQWTYTERVDAMTDEVQKSISVKNATGHELSAYMDDEGRFWLTVSLDGFDQFSSEQAPMLRVDKYEPFDFNTQMLLQEMTAKYAPEDAKLLYVWNPSFINVMLQANSEDGVFQVGDEAFPITKFMKGKKIVLRYWLGTGGAKDTEFTLAGFAENAPKVLKLTNQ